MAMVRIFLLMAALHSANVALAETEVKGRPALVLDDEAAPSLGGSIDFHLQGQGVNPLSWAAKEWPQSMGHFLCYRGCGRENGGAVERTDADLEMEVDALFIE